MFKYLLTLLLLFIAPHHTALAPVLEQRDEGPTFECSDDRYWYGEINYYSWEDCLFDYSGTHEDDRNLDPADHEALFLQVWTDYMADTAPPEIRVDAEATTEICGEGYAGCFDYGYQDCGPWLTCLNPDMTIVVADTSERTLLHETAHAIDLVSTWSPYWGSSYGGHGIATNNHGPVFRCLLLDIYHYYTDHVDPDAYLMLADVCTANGWASYTPPARVESGQPNEPE